MADKQDTTSVPTGCPQNNKTCESNKLVLTERASVEEADVVRLIDQIVEEELGRPSLLSVRFGTRYAEDLPDSPQFQLAVLPSDIPAGAGENCADGVVQSILNGGTRTYKSWLLSSLGSDRGRLMKHAREHLTYRAIQKEGPLSTGRRRSPESSRENSRCPGGVER